MSDHQVSTPLSGDQAALTRRYAGSLYELAEHDGVTDVVANDMRQLAQLWTESAEWRTLALDPRLKSEAVNTAVTDVASRLQLSALTKNFLAVVVQNCRLSSLPAIVTLFLKDLATSQGDVHVDVKSAHPLSITQRDSLVKSLSTVVGGKVRMNVTQDPSMIAGLSVKFGSQFIDASVKSKLDHLERKLKASAGS